MKTVTLQNIADFLNGTLIGNPEQEIKGLQGIMEAQSGDITFLANPKYKDQLPLCKASAVIVSEGVEVEGMNLIQTKNPRMDFAKLVGLMVPPKKEIPGVSDQAFIDPSAKIGKEVTIYPGVHIGANSKVGDRTVLYTGTFVGDNVSIGEDCLIYSSVSILHETIIGNRVVINPNSVLGSEGFGYERDGDRHFKIPQVGNIIIEDDVEIGSLCAIDCGSIKATIIKQGTKLDNLIHIAHNCELGENNLVLSQAGIAGTVKTGKNVYFAGKAGCMDHVTICDRAQIGGGAVVTGNIEEPGQYFGYPARPYREWQKASALFYKSDELRKKNMELEKRIKRLEELLLKEEKDKEE